jgi:hypothetical protein
MSKILFILKRPPSSIEVYARIGLTFLLEFAPNELPKVLEQFSAAHVKIQQSFSEFFAKMDYTKSWTDGLTSNFEYLMHLNLWAGRSFNDLQSYPTFPQVLTGNQFSLSNPTAFRDLTKPLAPITSEVVCGYLRKLEPFSNEGKIFTEFESIPEFYCFPDFLSKENLPSWATSQAEFVYCNRKALESDLVSSNLYQWIDRTFGYQSQSVKLFNKPHVAQSINSSFRPEIFQFEVRPASLFFSPGSQVLRVLDTNGNIQRYKFNLSTPDFQFLDETELSDPTLREGIRQGKVIQIFDRTLLGFVAVTSSFSGYFAVSWKTGKVKAVSSGTPIVDIACSTHWTAAVTAAGLTTMLFEDDRYLFPIQEYRGLATCCAVSDIFHLLVIGTRDGHLVLHNLPSAATSRVLDLKGAVPYKLLITDSFGFVVACVSNAVAGKVSHLILVFTVNGEFLRSESVKAEVASLSKWTSRKGFDYIAFQVADEEDEATFFLADVFKLSPAVRTCRISLSILSLKYLPQSNHVFVAQKDGHISFLHEPDDII